MEKIEQKIQLSEIIVRKLLVEETLSQEENERLKEWLECSEENKAFYQKVRRQKDLRDYEMIVSLYNEEKGWKTVDKELRSHAKKWKIMWTGLAACVVILFTLSIWVYWGKNPEPQRELTVQISQIEPGKQQAVLHLASGKQVRLDEKDTVFSIGNSNIRVDKGRVEYGVRDMDTTIVYNMIVVPRGGIYSLVLSDGTTVYLNSESKLRYPVKFQGEAREVRLVGEAYFDVVSDADHPFIVHSGNMQVRALGTSFNVSAYPDETEYQTTLESGKVEVRVEGMSKTCVLTPGMQAVWNRELGTMVAKEVSAEALVLWREGIIVMNGESLDDVMRALCRWYDVDYEYVHVLDEKYTFTGRINRNEYLGDVLKTLTLMGGPQFEVRNSVIYIK